MHSSRNSRRRGVVIVSAALLASLGFTATAIAVEPAPDASVVAAGAPIRLAQNTPQEDVPIIGGAAPVAAPATRPVSYTSEQADRGKARYVKTCVDCHGEDLKGGLNGGAPLTGGKFDQDFGGAPASALFLFMSTKMPPESPGRFSASVYADLMAYVLKRNGYQPGAALPSNVDALDNLVLEK
jgi:mono/diheme cytochrome c family protein